MNCLRKICEDMLQHVTTILAQYDPNTLAVLCSYAVLRQTMKLFGTSNPERHASLVIFIWESRSLGLSDDAQAKFGNCSRLMSKLSKPLFWGE